MSRVFVYHGTAAIYAPDIRAGGLPAIPPEAVEAGAEVRRSLGIRVRLHPAEARRDARAWTAAMIVEAFEGFVTGRHSVERAASIGRPRGIIVRASIDRSRISRPQGEVLRVRRLEPEEIHVDDVAFPEFGGLVVGRGDREAAITAIEAALDDFERLTDRRINVPFPKRRRK